MQTVKARARRLSRRETTATARPFSSQYLCREGSGAGRGQRVSCGRSDVGRTGQRSGPPSSPPSPPRRRGAASGIAREPAAAGWPVDAGEELVEVGHRRPVVALGAEQQASLALLGCAARTNTTGREGGPGRASGRPSRRLVPRQVFIVRHFARRCSPSALAGSGAGCWRGCSHVIGCFWLKNLRCCRAIPPKRRSREQGRGGAHNSAVSVLQLRAAWRTCCALGGRRLAAVAGRH